MFATDEDVKEGQLIVLFVLHCKMFVREDAADMLPEHEHLIPFENDEGIIHIPHTKFGSVLLEDKLFRTTSARSHEISERIGIRVICP
ncbi:unnamed protein product [Dibothriocephalus latus]|uniref:Uncharacterized protein n=1 Tax=Dibothriocephalus latus TaxID=60516 RepID=A0A3P6S4M7_DIBLA|nr:unnamed protein product [Dibothriocephalus latus]